MKLVAKWFFENEEIDGNNLVKKDLRRYSIKIWYTVWGKKFNFRYRSNYFTERRNPEAENRVTGASSFPPPEKRSSVDSLVKRSKNSRNLKFNLREDIQMKFSNEKFPRFSKCHDSKKKNRKKKNSIFLIDRSDQYSNNFIGKPECCSAKRDDERNAVRATRDLVSRGSRFPSVCVLRHQVFLEITVCRWKSSRGFGNTVTCWASR